MAVGRSIPLPSCFTSTQVQPRNAEFTIDGHIYSCTRGHSEGGRAVSILNCVRWNTNSDTMCWGDQMGTKKWGMGVGSGEQGDGERGDGEWGNGEMGNRQTDRMRVTRQAQYIIGNNIRTSQQHSDSAVSVYARSRQCVLSTGSVTGFIGRSPAFIAHLTQERER